MTYAQYGNIQASDYNGFLGGNPVTTSGKLNTVWATGGTNAGYGQTALANVAAGNVVYATDWANLVNKTANSATHQGASITSVSAPVTGGNVTYVSAIPTNLTTIYTSRLNAATQGSTLSNAATYNSTWSDALTFTHTISFANGDAARYFFNSGGQLKITCSHANNTSGINLLFNMLASNIGTVVMSSPTSGTITIAASQYYGITKVGGGGLTPTLSVNSGYYGLTTANTQIIRQQSSTGPATYYLGTFISMNAKTNGTQGANGDNGSVITIYTLWDEVPNGLTAGSGSTTTVTVQAPETTYLSNSWGTISVVGTVSGS
jgi:hypothetical protein